MSYKDMCAAVEHLCAQGLSRTEARVDPRPGRLGYSDYVPPSRLGTPTLNGRAANGHSHGHADHGHLASALQSSGAVASGVTHMFCGGMVYALPGWSVGTCARCYRVVSVRSPED